MRNRTLAAAALAAAMIGTAAWAQNDRVMQMMDQNGDGFISRAEADAFRGGRFDEMDADGDGAVSRREMFDRLQRRMEQEFGQKFDSFDADRDGRIDRREYKRNEGRFDRLDRNRDGKISRDELERGRKKK